jgi:hypothetical protein
MMMVTIEAMTSKPADRLGHGTMPRGPRTTARMAILKDDMTVDEFRAALVRAKLAPPADPDCRAVVNWLILKGFAKRKG